MSDQGKDEKLEGHERDLTSNMKQNLQRKKQDKCTQKYLVVLAIYLRDVGVLVLFIS